MPSATFDCAGYRLFARTATSFLTVSLIDVSVYQMDRYRSPVIRLVSILVVGVLAAVSAPGLSGPAMAAQGESCAQRFPESEWIPVRSGAVSIEVTGVPPGLTDRFVREIDRAASWIAQDMGAFSATVCLVSGESAFDLQRFSADSRRLRAHLDLPEQLFVLNISRYGFVGPASAYALAQHALWQHNGDASFPAPIASAIGQWYRARMLDRLEQYRRDVMFTNFFDTEAIVDWTRTEQKLVQNWDPETNFASIGHFIEFAVETRGTQMLSQTDDARWSQIEGEWRVSLRNELRGRDDPTTGWVGGGAVVIGVLLVAMMAITLGLISKHRRRRHRPTPQPIPGLFSE